MAVYSKLLLSTGGGIISRQQQADQTQDTATVLIGLGGTGVNCIRTIKTQVHIRLKPDDMGDVVPRYDHIRFIGVDTTEKTRGDRSSNDERIDETKKANVAMALDDSEFFSIANKHIQAALSNKLALKQRPELAWLEDEKIELPNLTDAGAGGIRQVGRFMMMDKSQEFIARVEQEINTAKRGLTNPRVNIHIFSGLSGGTGSGCFLDVCYMIRNLSKRIGGVTIFGYFFLPDVNLSVVPFEDVDVRTYIPKNGYAAMQELDYCMSIQSNGGEFEQFYKGNKRIKWEQAPVDMCHLICATDKNNNEIPDAYNYAMNVTAEYVMDFLTKSDKGFGLAEHLSNFRNKISQSDSKKTFGSEMAYCVIGASCARIPIRELNTYLASELFNKFAVINKNAPTDADIKELNASVFMSGGRDSDYDALKRAILKNADSPYEKYDDYKLLLDNGTNEALVAHYEDQYSQRKSVLEKNARNLISENSQESLISRLNAALQGILVDIEKGPVYAYRLLSSAEKSNLLNVIDALIEQNNSKKDSEIKQDALRTKELKDKEQAFFEHTGGSVFGSIFGGRGDQKRFNEYDDTMYDMYFHRLQLDMYAQIDLVLKEFRKQIIDVTGAYYMKLNRVIDTLLNTFAENRNALTDRRLLQNSDSFAAPMVTIEDLKKSLDAQINDTNCKGMFDLFIRTLLENKDEWTSEDENRISRMIVDFFVNKAFSDFAGKTITSFLRDKYENKFGGRVDDAQLRQYVYRDWLKLLTEKASPLFYFNSSVWSEDRTSKIAFVSFPATSAPIKAAVEDMHNVSNIWSLKSSDLTDRIFVMCTACGLPLSSYNNCTEYEKKFFEAKTVGIHLYEGKGVVGQEFNDWSKLPSITPQSLIDERDIPNDMAELVKNARTLYEKACQYGVVDGNGCLCEPSEEDLKAIEEICDDCEKKLLTAFKAADIPALERAIAPLKETASVKMIETPFCLPQDGLRDNEENLLRIQQDHFVSSSAVHCIAAPAVAKIENVLERKNVVIRAVEDKIAEIKDSGNAVADYCEAVFTGVISVEGNIFVYHRVQDGIADDRILSKRGEEYKFGRIPVYQGFVSYQALPAEIRAEIKKLTEDKFNAASEDLRTTGEKLQELFTQEHITVWAESAANFEERENIVAFIRELHKKFSLYCKENLI